MIFHCLTESAISPRIANPFQLEARDIDHCRAILVEWLGRSVADRVTVTPVIEGEAQYVEDDQEMPMLLRRQCS